MSDSDSVVALDKRDLFDSVRAAIKCAMLEQGSREDDSELFGDATDRTEACLKDLYASEALIKAQPDGGSAFGEFQQAGDCSVKTGGMTLRDYFAAKAMQAMISNDRFMGRIESEPANKGVILGECMAHEAYGLADIMLAERAK